MIDQLFTPHQAASQLAISPATVRRWCADHAAYLSPGANPDKGVFRRLSPADIEVLQEVKKLRSAGLSPGATNDRLNETVFPAPIVEASPVSQEGPQQAIVPVIVVEALERIQSRQDDQAARQEEQESRLRVLEEERHAQRLRVDAVFILAVGFIAGLIVGLAVWWFQ